MTTPATTCKLCGITKEAGAFYVSSPTRCKDCIKAAVNKHRQENLEAVRAYDRLRGGLPHRVQARAEYRETDAFKESHSKANAKYRNEKPEWKFARNVLYAAVRDKKLLPQPCFVCGDKAEAHHTDYSRPLDVVWLCDQHHKQVHAQHRQHLRAA